MQVAAIQLWRNRTIVEQVSSVTIKLFDTNPEPGVEVIINGVPLSLTGAEAVARLRSTLVLRSNLTPLSSRIQTSRDSKVFVGDQLVVGSERMKVTLVDDASNREFYSLRVDRGLAETVPAPHKVGDVVSVLVIERAAGILAAQDNRCFLPLQAGDMNRLGRFELEFELTEGTGGKYSIPETPLVVNVIGDFAGS